MILKVGQKVKVHWCPQFEPLPIELSVAWLVSSGWKSTAAAPGGQIYQAAWWICQVLPGRETVHPVVVEACRNLTEFHRIPDFHPWGTSMFTFSAGWTCKLWCPYLVSRQSVSTKEIILRFSLHTFLQMFLLNPFNQFCHHIQGWNTNVQSPEFITSTIRVCKGCWGLPQTGGTRSGNSCWNFTRAWCPNNILWIRFMLVSATGFVNGPAGFAIFLLWHGPSVRSCARQLEVVHDSYRRSCARRNSVIFLGNRVGWGGGGGKGTL